MESAPNTEIVIVKIVGRVSVVKIDGKEYRSKFCPICEGTVYWDPKEMPFRKFRRSKTCQEQKCVSAARLADKEETDAIIAEIRAERLANPPQLPEYTELDDDLEPNEDLVESEDEVVDLKSNTALAFKLQQTEYKSSACISLSREEIEAIAKSYKPAARDTFFDLNVDGIFDEATE